MEYSDGRFLPALWPSDYDHLPEETAPGTDLATTVVHPPETNLPDAQRESEWGSTLSSDDLSVNFRHSGWLLNRARMRSALVESSISPRTLSRFDLCGSDPWVAVDPNDPSRLTILANHCHSRWCVPCAHDRAARIAANLELLIEHHPHRFLTLTLKHSDTPLSLQLSRLLDSFRRLRRLPFWRNAVSGGAAVLEVKHSHRDNLWHPHLHVLLDSKFLRHQDISAEWFRITGDSYIVDIRLINSHEQAARYMTKYLTKPVPVTVINKPAALSELLEAFRGRRLVLTFGTWRGFPLTRRLDDTEWKALCPLPVLYARYDAGDEAAAETLAALLRCFPDAPHLVTRSPPHVPGPAPF